MMWLISIKAMWKLCCSNYNLLRQRFSTKKEEKKKKKHLLHERLLKVKNECDGL